MMVPKAMFFMLLCSAAFGKHRIPFIPVAHFHSLLGCISELINFTTSMIPNKLAPIDIFGHTESDGTGRGGGFVRGRKSAPQHPTLIFPHDRHLDNFGCVSCYRNGWREIGYWGARIYLFYYFVEVIFIIRNEGLIKGLGCFGGVAVSSSIAPTSDTTLKIKKRFKLFLYLLVYRFSFANTRSA